jgi:hypothetical protein
VSVSPYSDPCRVEDGYVVAACLDKYFGEPGVALARYEEGLAV